MKIKARYYEKQSGGLLTTQCLWDFWLNRQIGSIACRRCRHYQGSDESEHLVFCDAKDERKVY